MSKRASIFDETPELDVKSFAPKTAPDPKAPSAAQVRAISQAANFRSREAAPASVVADSEATKRAPRRYRTGRNVQLSLKARKEAVDAFYAVAELQGWVLGHTLERAIEALQRELGKAK